MGVPAPKKKNETFVTVPPPVTDASALIFTFAGAANTAPAPGFVIVIDGVGEAIRARGGRERQLEREVDAKPPRAAPLRRRVAVVALELEAAHEHAIGHGA